MYINNHVSPKTNAQSSEILLELSAKLAGVIPANLDKEIKNNLQILSGFFNFDWCTFCEFYDSSGEFITIYKYCSPLVNTNPIGTLHKDTTYLTNNISRGNPVFIRQTPDDLPKYAEWDRDFCLKNRIKTTLALPLKINSTILGGLYFNSIRNECHLTDKIIREFIFYGEIFASLIDRKRDAKKKKKQDYYVNISSNSVNNNICDVVGKSYNFQEVLLKVKQVAPTNAAVMLLGETGTGKGVIAKAIHNASPRKNMPIVQINCASLAPNLIESELFGHEKGAFTGALSRRAGCFERADESTLFLDEIGELPMELQAKLLRVLQDGEFERVGGNETLKTDTRIIAATNKDLEMEAKAGKFRIDLWYRLNIFPIYIPPLRERCEDIPYFLSYFIEKYSKWAEKHFDAITQDTINMLQNYSWPGNIRELENIVLQSIIASSDENLQIELPGKRAINFNSKKNIEELERAHILDTLLATGWRIEGPYGAARTLGIKPSTLRLRMKKYGIIRPKPQSL